ncbi:MAG: DUF1934 domain-containing protein [Lachnospiraceae bacterium]|nr:DUF1934 domain-containing protein [Lachnospiraceae bacterium]
MTKEVLVSISGLHHEQINGPTNLNESALKVVIPGTYYLKNGKHYVIYDEVVAGMEGTIRNKIKIQDKSLEIFKSGLTNTHMVFERNQKNWTYYETAFGHMIVAVNTRKMDVKVTDERIDVSVDYELDVNHEPLADCRIRLNIASKESRDHLLQ